MEQCANCGDIVARTYLDENNGICPTCAAGLGPSPNSKGVIMNDRSGWETRYHKRIDSEYRAEVRRTVLEPLLWQGVIFKSDESDKFNGQNDPIWRSDLKADPNYCMRDCEEFVANELLRISNEEWKGSRPVLA